MQPDRINGDGPENGTAIPYADRSTPHPEHHGGGGGVTRRDVAAIVVKLVGVYMVLQGFPPLVTLGQYGLAGPAGIPAYVWLYSLAMLGFYVGIGSLLLAYGDRAARWLLPRPDRSESAPPATGSPVEWQAAAFAVAGVVIIVFWAAPGFLFDLWRHFFRNNPDAPPGQIVEAVPYLVRHALELALGLWLFYGSKRLSLYWQRLRGQRPGPDEWPL